MKNPYLILIYIGYCLALVNALLLYAGFYLFINRHENKSEYRLFGEGIIGGLIVFGTLSIILWWVINYSNL